MTLMMIQLILFSDIRQIHLSMASSFCIYQAMRRLSCYTVPQLVTEAASLVIFRSYWY